MCDLLIDEVADEIRQGGNDSSPMTLLASFVPSALPLMNTP